MNTTNTYLSFKDYDGKKLFVSIADILDAGIPIFGDGPNEGEEMDLTSGDLFRQESGEFVKIS